jgi:hypothetical protein
MQARVTGNPDRKKGSGRTPASPVAAGWTTVGWRGVSARVPEDWNPVAVSGEGEAGYLRVVGPDTRSLEIKWEEPRGSVSVPDALERYFAKLRRAARKSRHPLQIQLRPRRLSGVRPREQAPLAYSWDAGEPGARKAYGVIWHCDSCRRLVIAEVLGGPDDDFALAPTLLKGIAEHGADGWNTWGMYGLVVPVPADYRLEGQQLMSGYLRLAFRRKASALRVERWGLANVALKGTPVRRWYLGRETGALARYRYAAVEEPWRGHAVVRLEGRERILPGALTAVQSLLALHLPALHFRGYVWHCPESNRIFALTGREPAKSAVTREVFERMVCHG